MGTISPNRSINIINFIFTITYIIAFIKIIEPLNLHSIKQNLQIKILTSAIIIVTIVSNKNIKSSIKDLTSGDAKLFYKVKSNRIKELQIASPNKIYKFKKISHIPQSIFSYDLEIDSKDWKNKCFCEFYKIKSVSTY